MAQKCNNNTKQIGILTKFWRRTAIFAQKIFSKRKKSRDKKCYRKHRNYLYVYKNHQKSV